MSRENSFLLELSHTRWYFFPALPTDGRKKPRWAGQEEKEMGGNQWNKIQRAVRLHDILVRHGVQEDTAVAATLEAVYGQDAAAEQKEAEGQASAESLMQTIENQASRMAEALSRGFGMIHPQELYSSVEIPVNLRAGEPVTKGAATKRPAGIYIVIDGDCSGLKEALAAIQKLSPS
jgi:hypothetical protein